MTEDIAMTNKDNRSQDELLRDLVKNIDQLEDQLFFQFGAVTGALGRISQKLRANVWYLGNTIQSIEEEE